MEQKKFQITKSTTELYKIRHESGMYWADIIVDDQDKRGRIQIASDYGSWQNYWGDCGYSFKEFLTKIDIGYFAGKIRETDYFDHQASCTKIITDILLARRDNDISKGTARTTYDAIIDIIKTKGSSKESYVAAIQDSIPIWKFYQSPECIPLITGISPLFRQFFNEPWQAFINQLKEELTDKSE